MTSAASGVASSKIKKENNRGTRLAVISLPLVGGERSEGGGERRTKEVGVEEEALFSLVHNVLPRTKSTISNSIFPAFG